MEISTTDPNDHVASLPDDRRRDIAMLDAEITKRMPGESRVLWEGRFWGGSDQKIIGYGTFSHTNSSGKTSNWFMVGLAAQKNYISMYVNAVDDDGYVLKKYADRLGKAKVGSASISFNSVEDINFEILMELVDVAAKGID